MSDDRAPHRVAGRAEGVGRRSGAWFDRTLILLLLLGGALMMLPFAWMFSTSWRLARDSFSLPPQWLPTGWRI